MLSSHHQLLHSTALAPFHAVSEGPQESNGMVSYERRFILHYRSRVVRGSVGLAIFHGAAYPRKSLSIAHNERRKVL